MTVRRIGEEHQRGGAVADCHHDSRRQHGCLRENIVGECEGDIRSSTVETADGKLEHWLGLERGIRSGSRSGRPTTEASARCKRNRPVADHTVRIAAAENREKIRDWEIERGYADSSRGPDSRRRPPTTDPLGHIRDSSPATAPPTFEDRWRDPILTDHEQVGAPVVSIPGPRQESYEVRTAVNS